MDPQFEKTPGLALPNPATEQGIHGVPSHSGGVAHEALLPQVEGVANVAPVPTVPPHISAGPAAMHGPVSGQAPQAPAVAAPAVSGDDNTDALDEEWINKAKAIVEQTKHDPRLESTQLSKVKAEYLRIRYNKHIKVAEEPSK